MCYLIHETLPMCVAMQVEVEGHIAVFRGQFFWNGNVPVDTDIYYPLLSRVRVISPNRGRVLMPILAGAVHSPTASVNVRKPYMGQMASPCFILDGGERGFAFLDDQGRSCG